MSAAIAVVLTEVLLHSALFPLMGVPCRKNTSSVVRLDKGVGDRTSSNISRTAAKNLRMLSAPYFPQVS